MSAIRTRDGEYVDPMTRQPFTPEPPRAHEVYPVEVRKATPEELARFDDPVDPEPRVSPIHFAPARPIDAIGLVPKRMAKATRRRSAALSAMTDAEIRAAIREHGTARRAAAAIGVAEVTMYRRTRAMRGAS